jgi:F-type H+-transporting ATPase subunit gamma
MKMVAAAKLRRAQQRITQLRPYADTLDRVLASLAGRTEHAHRLLEQRETARVWLVVVTSDKGLCGSFNANLLRQAERELRSARWPEVEVVAVGRKASDFFRRRQWSIAHEERETMSQISPEDGPRLARMLMEGFTTGQVDQVWLLYNRFASLIRHEARLEQLLPIERSQIAEAGADPQIDYLYEPDPAALLEHLLPRHVETKVQRALYDSGASEQAARMTAMDAATKNANEMIDRLTLLYNRTRQAAITKELIEIVSGAQALGD